MTDQYAKFTKYHGRLRVGEVGADRVVAVYVDGVQKRHVYEADTIEGWANGYAEDENGRPYVEGGEVARVRYTGKVCIVMEDIAEGAA